MLHQESHDGVMGIGLSFQVIHYTDTWMYSATINLFISWPTVQSSTNAIILEAAATEAIN